MQGLGLWNPTQGYFHAATNITLCVSDSWPHPVAKRYLHVDFAANDDPLLKNTYLTCNSDMWNQEYVRS